MYVMKSLPPTTWDPGLLRLARVVQRLNQAEVARRAGISRPFLCRIERGDERPSQEVLDRILRALDLAPGSDAAEGAR
jgi:transcriptional regulator with XRE-family HTH domain